MAVNENLYNWLWKTQGSGAAEWYRNNPNKPHESNPFVNPNEAKWFPKASADDPYRSQQIARDPYRDQTYASAMPEYVEESVTETSPSPENFASSYLQALYDMPESDYEQFSKSLGKGVSRFDSEEALKQMYPGATYSQYEVPRYGDIEITQYGIGSSPGNKGGSYLFNKYIDDPEFDRLQADYSGRIYPAIQNLSPSDFADGSQKYDALMAEARQNTEAQRALARQYNTLYSGKPVEGWDENAFYAENINLPTRQNLAALIQQSQEGVQSSQDFLDNYVTEGREEAPPRSGPRGEEIDLRTGPRGEILGDIAEVRKVKRDGPATDIYYDKQMKQFVPLMNPGTIILDKLKKADQPKTDFDEQQARVASSAADKYREKAKVEDPFRSGAFG